MFEKDEPLGLLTLQEAAALLRLSRSRLYNLACRGVVPSVQLGGQGKILFVRRELQSALKPKARKTSDPSHVSA